MTDLLIRPSTADDLPAVLSLLEQLADSIQETPQFELARLRAIHAEMERSPASYLNVVAVDEGRVVGFISLVFYKTFYHRVGTALINELVVDRAQRGSGVGGRLIDWAKAEARTRHMDELEVSTERDNEGALRFYRRHGFDEESVLLGMELDA